MDLAFRFQKYYSHLFPGSDERSAYYLPKNQPELRLISLEDVAVEPVRWLWYPYIPLGKLTILHGDPGEGKTTLALWIAAACSRGQALPGGETGEPLTVLY